MKNSKTVIGVVLLVAILLVAVGYAAIQNVTLNVQGTLAAQASDANFKVEFTGEPTTNNDLAKDATVTASIDSANKLLAHLDVSGLTAKDETVTATYTISNLSKDLTAKIVAGKIVNSNEDYFEVTSSVDNEMVLKGDDTTVTVTVKLRKTPVAESAEELQATITVPFGAEPIQP